MSPLLSYITGLAAVIALGWIGPAGRRGTAPAGVVSGPLAAAG